MINLARSRSLEKSFSEKWQFIVGDCENTKLNSSVLDNLLSSDFWLDAETCLAYGLVDKII